MIKIIFRDLPKSKELDLDFESIKSLSNISSFNPGIKEIGGTMPENLKTEKHIKEVKKEVKVMNGKNRKLLN